MSDHIIRAYKLDGQGGGEAISDEAIHKANRADDVVWIHLDANHPDTPHCLEAEIEDLDPFVVGALLAEESRPRMVQIGDGVLMVLYGVNLNTNADPHDMVSICLWADAKRVISVSRVRLMAAGDVEKKIKAGRGPKDIGGLLTMLSSFMFERMEPILDGLDEATDDIEAQVLIEPNGSLREAIIGVRLQAIMFRRYMSPQRDAIEHLCMADLDWLNASHRRHLQEVYNHVTRYVEDLDAVRERAQIVKDEIANALADTLNRQMYILSIIAAIFLPLGFLTGLLGINLGGIPGATDGNGFWIFSGMLIMLIIAQIAVFKWLRWF